MRTDLTAGFLFAYNRDTKRSDFLNGETSRALILDLKTSKSVLEYPLKEGEIRVGDGMDQYLHLISQYTASLNYDDVPPSTIRAVKHKFIDSMGCALGAYFWEPCEIARRLCLPVESRLAARVIGSLVRTTPDMAAFANGTMVRTMDYNDCCRLKNGVHPSDTISAVLAAAEAVHGDG